MSYEPSERELGLMRFYEIWEREYVAPGRTVEVALADAKQRFVEDRIDLVDLECWVAVLVSRQVPSLRETWGR